MYILQVSHKQPIKSVIHIGCLHSSRAYNHRIKTYCIQKVDSSINHYHAMIHHQNADAMVLASALMRGITPLDVRHFEYFQGGECLSNTHWLGPWRQHFDDELRFICQNHWKIIRKTKKSVFCVVYSVIQL